MSESGNIIAETAARIFADLADPQAVNSAADGGWKEPMWRALAETGLTLAWVGEQHGGSGASLADGATRRSLAAYPLDSCRTDRMAATEGVGQVQKVKVAVQQDQAP